MIYIVSIVSTWRHFCIKFAITFLFGVIIWRVLDLSYFRASSYYNALEVAHRTAKIVTAKRGMILDRNLEVLAIDDTKILFGVDPYSADVDADLPKILILADMLELQPQFILEKCKKRREMVDGNWRKIKWVPLCEIKGESLYEAVKTLHISGFYGMKQHKRRYPLGRTTCHITGFINHDNIASGGIERYMDFYLRGQDGYIESEKDGKRRELVRYRKKHIKHRDGFDVVLTIDKNIQNIAYAAVQNLVQKFSPDNISIIVSDVKTGELLALVNFPEYDPNDYGKFPIIAMKNLAASNVYEPGSVFKIIASSFVLERHLANEDTVFDCQIEKITHHGKQVVMPKDHVPFDKLTLVEAIRKSSNRALAQMGLMLGEEQFYQCVREFGFGEKAGYGFDGESVGILPPPNRWDAWTITRMPIGHSIGAVPMQTHYAMSVIANDGVLLKPNIIRWVMHNQSTVLTFNPIVKRRVISVETAKRMQKILHNPDRGTLPCGVTFAGKSGTGQKIINNKYSHDHHTSSYSGFFPANAPRFVVTVIVDNAKVPHSVAWGSVVASPAFKEIAENISKYIAHSLSTK